VVKLSVKDSERKIPRELEDSERTRTRGISSTPRTERYLSVLSVSFERYLLLKISLERYRDN